MNEITNDETKCRFALGALQFIEDPEIGLNVVDLGLIYQIDFDENEKRIYCSHSLTTQFCPMGQSISSGISNALQHTFTEYDVKVRVTFDPPWNSQRISSQGREFLNR